ncbi:DMT family transporter [Amphritea sp. HPY]|uniref:DMT family transporter n=1 Tax=Amphritea sp. HPY TaxID=3421652 RepID=UPI003D7E0DA7
MHTKNIKADLLLLMVAAIWGFSLVAQSMGLDFLGPFGFNAGRFLLGALTLLPVVVFFHRPQQVNWRPMLIGSLTAGFCLFMGASMQQAGLQYTTAGNAGFITSMYIVLVPVFGLALAQKTGLNTWIGAAFAVLGLYLLSVSDSFEINSGDVLILLGACFWAGHVLIIAKLARELDNLLLSLLQFLFCGVLCTVIALFWETERFVGSNIIAAWLPLLFAGALTVGIGHTLQVIGQKSAPASHAAIIMSLEAVFAALGGWLWLNEHLSNRELTGCMLMLAGVLLSQIPFKAKPKVPAELGA